MDGSHENPLYVDHVETILAQHESLDPTFKGTSEYIEPHEIIHGDHETTSTTLNTNKNNDKQSAAWTTYATLTLLKLYESKMDMQETPKKKTRMWIAISEALKTYNIDVTPDQVRWKINALTKKYKHCIEYGQQESFKYFKEMDSIFGQYNEDEDTCTVSELIQRKRDAHKNLKSINEPSIKTNRESKAIIELRKIRLANRIEADRSQSKIKLEKQWLDYLKRQEALRQFRDEIYVRNLKLKEEELELRKRELEIKESLELRKIQMKEKEQEEILQIEREKCELLRGILLRKK